MQFHLLNKALLLAAGVIGSVAVQAQEVIYYHTDALGSVVAVTDANRNVLERNEYEPYGKVVNHALQDGPGYTGHVADAQTGLIYMQQRYYDDDLGEFPTVDPVTAYSVGGTFHRYWYANNNPYKFTDPDGRQAADRFSDAYAKAAKEGRTEEFKVFEKPAIAVVAVMAAPVIAEIGWAALANPVTATAVGVGAVEVGIGASGGMVPTPLAGGGAALENVAASAATRIQNAANRTGQTISLVGSRAAGKATAKSDWDYVVNANSATRNSLSRSLPGAGNLREGIRPNLDVFKGEVDRTRPFIDFLPLIDE